MGNARYFPRHGSLYPWSLLRGASACNTLDREAAARLYFGSGPEVTPPSLPDPGLRGPYAVKSFLYAGERNPRRTEYAAHNIAVKTAPVDISAFFSPDAAHWGFDEHSVPLNGKVWYPEGNGPFPLVVCVHGNHDPYEASELGYGWLGELLASRGFVFASIDENFLNGRTREQRPGGPPPPPRLHDTLVEHAPLHPARGEARRDQRGAHRTLPRRGSGGDRRDIQQAFLVSRRRLREFRLGPPVPAVDYLVLQGSADGDVSSDFGLRFVNRGTPAPGTFRAGLWVYGANHAQVNSDWARHQDPPFTLRANRDIGFPGRGFGGRFFALGRAAADARHLH